MKINLHFSPGTVDELYLSDRTVVVIDVLRATSSIITAMGNGAQEVIPVGSIEFAMKISGNLFGGRTLLAGERNTIQIEGFNLGNSPLEFTPETVKDKSVVIYTTNGTKALVKTRFSEQTIVCAFLNLQAAAEYLLRTGKDVEIICSGRNNQFSLEDTVCAGLLIKLLQSLGSYDISDSASAAILLANNYGADISGMMRNSEHGKILLENGFAEDIEYCSQVSVSQVVPIFISNIIKA